LTLITFRKVLSGLFFLLFLMLFAGGERLSAILSGILPPFQFVPALLRTLAQPAALFAAGLIGIVVLTLIFGRVYCSFLCPLGALQDLLIAASRKIGLRPRHAYRPPNNLLRYAILAVAAGALVAGFQSAVSLLDPFAWWGRLVTDFVLPLLTGSYNLAILAGKPFDLYLHPRQTPFITPPALALSAAFLALIVYLALTRGRLYCNTVCPVGAFLGLLARFSLFRFAAEKNACTECARCAEVCKAGCIDPQNAAIDMSRCVACFNCLDACARTTIRYRPQIPAVRFEDWSPARRRVVLGGFAGGLALTLASFAGLRQMLRIPSAKAQTPVTPPGSGNLARFTSRCCACSLCVAACPTAVLAPSFADYGTGALLQPKLNYEQSYCDYECNVCGRVCPTGAIADLALAEKKLIAIGEAKLLEDICVVYVNKTNCGACGEVCPTHAMRFEDRENILYPEVDQRYCIGCGACQLACPTTPRSIVVEPHKTHKRAEKYPEPARRPAPPPTASGDDFPF